MKAQWGLITRSTLAYLLAVTVVLLLHETSHAIAGITQGSAAVQLPFAVGYRPELGTTSSIIATATGPLFSLVSGVILIWFRPWRRSPFWGLAFSWFAFLSAEEGFGYFTISGLGAGDTSVVLGLLDAPGWIYILCTIFGIAGLFFLALCWVPHAADFSTDIDEYRAISMWTWIFGTIIITLLTLLYVLLSPGVPADDSIAVMLGAFSLGVFAPLSFIYDKRRDAVGFAAERPRFGRGAVTTGLVVLILLVIGNLLLTRGLVWG